MFVALVGSTVDSLLVGCPYLQLLLFSKDSLQAID